MLFWRPKYYLILAWFLVVTIVILSLLPSSEMPQLHWWGSIQPDKIGHILFYSASAWCFKKYSQHQTSFFRISYIYLALILMGIALECLQKLMVLGRQFDLFDVIANCIGVILVKLASSTK